MLALLTSNCFTSDPDNIFMHETFVIAEAELLTSDVAMIPASIAR